MDRVIVVSDGTGRTAEQALNAALTQFQDAKIYMTLRQRVRTEDQVLRVVDEASETNALIVHTLVTDRLRHLMVRVARERNVETIDLMGSLLDRLSHHLHISPAERPGLFSRLNEAYFRRIETMEFAISHDDGLRAHELDKAEIILLGVSRTFKTPVSVYLAFKGWFVANVPIVMDVELPEAVYSLPPTNVFCLDTYAPQLADLRRTRHEYLGGEVGKYADIDYVRAELVHARKIFCRRPEWPVINVLNKPIEEIATEILAFKDQGQPIL